MEAHKALDAPKFPLSYQFSSNGRYVAMIYDNKFSEADSKRRKGQKRVLFVKFPL